MTDLSEFTAANGRSGGVCAIATLSGRLTSEQRDKLEVALSEDKSVIQHQAIARVMKRWLADAEVQVPSDLAGVVGRHRRGGCGCG